MSWRKTGWEERFEEKDRRRKDSAEERRHKEIEEEVEECCTPIVSGISMSHEVRQNQTRYNYNRAF